MAIRKNVAWVDQYKIYVPQAWGVGNMRRDRIMPFIGEPNSCCSETYLVIGPFKSEKEAKSIIKYTQTKFFHILLFLVKLSHHSTQKMYSFIPMQDFSEPWTDKKLYKKYGLTKEEIAFIESMIRPMD